MKSARVAQIVASPVLRGKVGQPRDAPQATCKLVVFFLCHSIKASSIILFTIFVVLLLFPALLSFLLSITKQFRLSRISSKYFSFANLLASCNLQAHGK